MVLMVSILLFNNVSSLRTDGSSLCLRHIRINSHTSISIFNSRSGTVLGFPLGLCLGSARGAKDTEMIFLVSQLFGPVRVILVSCRKHNRKTVSVRSEDGAVCYCFLCCSQSELQKATLYI